MNISTIQFKQLLAEYAKVPEAEASAFVDALTQTVLSHVADEEVTLQGFGTFATMTNQQGKRIVFRQDDRLRAAINAPFSFFEPVVLSAPVAEEGQEKKETSDNQEPEIVTENSEQEEPQEVPSAIEMSDHAEQPESSDSQVDLDATESFESAPPPETSASAPQPKSSAPKESEPENLWWKRTPVVAAAVTAVVVVLLLCLFTCGSSKKSTSPSAVATASTVVETTSVEQESEDVSATESSESQESSATTKAEPAPASTQSLSNIPESVVLQEGERLTLLALRYYGDKSFWCYIYEANAERIKNPDNVPAGIRLKLPRPNEYGIDANNEVSVRKAKQKAKDILTQKNE